MRETRWTRSAGGAVLLAIVACGPPAPEWTVISERSSGSEEVVRIAGSVERVELEGGFYAIRAEDGTRYEPANLPERFRVDGLSVEIDAVPQEGMASIRMVGPIVEIVRIRARDADAAGGDAGRTAPEDGADDGPAP